MTMKDNLLALRSPFLFKALISSCFALFLLFFPVRGISGGEGDFPPWNFDGGRMAASKGQTEERGHAGLPAKALLSGVTFFADYISRVDGDRCPMMPTCSSYSKEVIGKHGFFIGITMTADRLIHEANEMEYAPVVRAGDKNRFYDPVGNNDFWWTKPGDRGRH